MIATSYHHHCRVPTPLHARFEKHLVNQPLLRTTYMIASENYSLYTRRRITIYIYPHIIVPPDSALKLRPNPPNFFNFNLTLAFHRFRTLAFPKNTFTHIDFHSVHSAPCSLLLFPRLLQVRLTNIHINLQCHAPHADQSVFCPILVPKGRVLESATPVTLFPSTLPTFQKPIPHPLRFSRHPRLAHQSLESHRPLPHATATLMPLYQQCMPPREPSFLSAFLTLSLLPLTVLRACPMPWGPSIVPAVPLVTNCTRRHRPHFRLTIKPPRLLLVRLHSSACCSPTLTLACK